MSDPHAMQRLCGLMRKAVQDYEMISPGDKIMVGVSCRCLLYLKISCFVMSVWVLYGFLIEPIPQDLIPYLQLS